MNFYLWLGFFLAASGIAISPGNGALLSMTHGLAYGFRRTHIMIFGLQVGLVTVMLISGLGIGSLLSASPTAFTVLKIIGSLYLIWLGGQQIFYARRNRELVDLHQSQVLPSRWARFTEGFICDVTNAKGIVFMVAILPQFMEPNRPLAPQLAILIATMVVIDTVVMHGYALLASKLANVLKSPRARTRLNYLFGAVLVLVGVSVFFAPNGA